MQRGIQCFRHRRLRFCRSSFVAFFSTLGVPTFVSAVAFFTEVNCFMCFRHPTDCLYTLPPHFQAGNDIHDPQIAKFASAVQHWRCHSFAAFFATLTLFVPLKVLTGIFSFSPVSLMFPCVAVSLGVCCVRRKRLRQVRLVHDCGRFSHCRETAPLTSLWLLRRP